MAKIQTCLKSRLFQQSKGMNQFEFEVQHWRIPLYNPIIDSMIESMIANEMIFLTRIILKQILRSS